MRSRFSKFIPALALVLAAGCGDSGGGTAGGTDATSGGDVQVTDAGGDVQATTDTGGDDDVQTVTDTGGGEDTVETGDSGPGPDAGGDSMGGPDTTTEPDTGTPGVDPDGTFETATEIGLGESIDDVLDPTGDVDYFRFTGVKGDPVIIQITAQIEAYDPASIDTVITLYGPDKQPLAENDDPFPRTTNDSTLLTILPADGDYYVRVEECWTWIGEKGLTEGCAEPKDKDLMDYNITVALIDPLQPIVVADAELGDTAAEATPVTYGTTQETLYVSYLYGTFEDASDVDVFAFTVPAALNTGTAELFASFQVFPSGVEANGSTAEMGPMYVTTADDPATVIAWTNAAAGGAIGAPLQKEVPYLLFVTHPDGAGGANPFYFIYATASGSNPPEADDAGNGTLAGAEALTDIPNDTGSHFFILGDIVGAPADVDYYSFAMPAGLGDGPDLGVSCSAQAQGSGLRQFKYSVLKADGTSVGAVTEDATNAAQSLQATVPPGADKLILKIEAGSQSPDVTGTYYLCGVHVTAPQP